MSYNFFNQFYNFMFLIKRYKYTLKFINFKHLDLREIKMGNVLLDDYKKDDPLLSF